MRQLSTAARVFDIKSVETEIAEALRDQPVVRRLAPIVDYSGQHAQLPAYVEHRENVGQIGALAAEAVVSAYEETAKEVEAMGEELKQRIDKLEKMKNDAVAVLAQVKETAAAFRDAGKAVFLQIEDCTLLVGEVRSTCAALKGKIAGTPT